MLRNKGRVCSAKLRPRTEIWARLTAEIFQRQAMRHAEFDEPLTQLALQRNDCGGFSVGHRQRGEALAPFDLDANAADRVRVRGEMKLTIDNLNGAGETDYSALLDAEAPPKIVRKLNQPPVLYGVAGLPGSRHCGCGGQQGAPLSRLGRVVVQRISGGCSATGVRGRSDGSAGLPRGAECQGRDVRTGSPRPERTRGDGRLHRGTSGHRADRGR